ncbi:MAG: hypothetical protein ACI4XR_01340 [Bacilli bacterium]
MKKIGYCIVIICSIFFIFGCQKKVQNIEGNLSEIMDKLYVGLPDDFPKVEQTNVTKDNKEYYLGDVNFSYKEALASEPLMSSIAHSVVLIRLDDTSNINSIKEEIKEKVNPKKWICVEVEEENVIVESKGNLILLVMDNEYASIIKDNFLALEGK